MHGAVIQASELLGGATRVGANGKRPQRRRFTEDQFSSECLFLKAANRLFIGPSKEEKLLEITLPDEIRFAGRKTRILGQLARRECLEGHDGYVGVF